jgi:hypothetical protein
VPYVAMTAEDISYFQFRRKRPRALPTRIPESIITRPDRYCFASFRYGALCLIGI